MSWHPTQDELVALRERFWRKVDRREMWECWLWTGCAKTGGYGVIVRMRDGKQEHSYAHRIALQLCGVRVLETDFVLHSCDVKLCCNPAHLRVGTKRDNAIDRENRNRLRHHRGESNKAARLKSPQVQAIRSAYAAGGVTYKQLAAHYGVCETTIANVVRGDTWAIA